MLIGVPSDLACPNWGPLQGVFVGAVALASIDTHNSDPGFGGWPAALRAARTVAAGSFCSGAAWGPVVYAMDSTLPNVFTIGALLTGVICGLVFWLGITITSVATRRSPASGRAANGNLVLHRVRDLTLSVTVAGAAAFFVGTDAGCEDPPLTPTPTHHHHHR